MSKIKRIEQFEELEKRFETGFYDNLSSIPAELIVPKALSAAPSAPPRNKISSVDFLENNIISLPYASTASKKGILVFCSAKNPGGGVKRGSVAQEEEIALHSNWYFKARKTKSFYLQTGDSAINTDNMIYVEKGYILKNEHFEDIAPVPVSFIGATAVNLNGMLSQNKSVSTLKVYEVMGQRIENVLKLAEAKKITHLYLGAWGCGVFGLDSQKMAAIFKEKIKDNHYSGHISFVIKGPSQLAIFQKELDNTLQIKVENKTKIKKK